MPNAQSNVIGQIQPTLFIGLGGTGKEVLLRLRRKFWEKFGAPNLPCASFLWIDADSTDSDATGDELDAVLKIVRFSDSEKIELFSGRGGSDLADLIMNPEQWPQIYDWLYPEVTRFGTENREDLKGVRACGRLQFFKRLAEKRGLGSRVRAALDELSSWESLQATQNVFANMSLGAADFTTENNVQVVLICSVAGGTGSGTMLDMAFYLKHLAQRPYMISSISGVVFLPNVYHANAGGGIAQRSFGNAYAALKELEFFTLRQGDDGNERHRDFQVQWEKGNSEKVQGPPFSNLYLLEMCNEAGVFLKPENRSELFTSVAESLFLDFMPSAFSTWKRSRTSVMQVELSCTRDLITQPKGIPIVQQFARRYASFGLSKIEFPFDAVLRACSSKLAAEMLACILHDETRTDVRRGIENEVDADPTNGPQILNLFGDHWKEAIQNEVDAAYRGRPAGKPGDIDELRALFETLETKLLRADSTDAGEMGIAVGFIREKTKRALEGSEVWLTKWVQGNLDEGLRGLKSLTKSTGYLPYAKGKLEELRKATQVDEKARFESLRKKAIADALFSHRRWETHLKELTFSQSSPWVGALGLRRWTNEFQLRILKESHQAYLMAKAAFCLYDECIKVAIMLAARIEQLEKNLKRFQLFIEKLRADLHERSEQYLQFGDSTLFIQVFDRERNWKDFYRLGIREMKELEEVKPSEELAAFLRQSFDSAVTPLDLIESFQVRGVLDKALMDYCETRFRQDFNSNPRNVRLLENSIFNDESTSKETISKFVRNALPMMRVTPDLAGKEMQTSKLAYLGMCDIYDSKWKDFADKVRAELSCLGYGNVNRISTGTSSEVYLHLVNYAFPLSALHIVVNECRDAYSKFYRNVRKGTFADKKYQIPLHLSRKWEGKFPGLVAYSEEQAIQVTEAREILLFGVMMRVLTVLVGDPTEFCYTYGHPLNRTISLGFKWEAIDSLCADAKTRELLMAAIRDKKSTLTQEQLVALYWAIQYMLSGPQSGIDEPERALLNQELKQIDRQLISMELLTKEMKMEGESDSSRAEICKVAAGDTLDWSGEIPVLRNIEQWMKLVVGDTD